MVLQRTLLLLTSLATWASSSKICEPQGGGVFCQCDDYKVDEVRVVTCTLLTNLTAEDDIWGGFEEQRLVDSISINGRGSEALTGIPVRIFKSTKHVRQVAFTDNRLGTLLSYSFTNLDKLETINLERNEITALEEYAFSSLPNLTNLILSENHLRILPTDSLHHLPKLTELYLDRNDLEVIGDHAFQHLHSLREMDIFSNKLNHISSKTFVGLRSLIRLDMSKNSLAALKDRIFRGSPNLKDLDLSRNRITEITPHAFDGLKHLQRLNLKDNKLYSLQKTIFKGAPHLLHINLADNKLITFQKHILDPLVNSSNTEFFINFKGNPFECRCDMLWISSFVNNSKTYSESLSLKKELRSMKCSFGEHRKANLVNVTDLRRDEMICPDPPIHKVSPVYVAPPIAQPARTTLTTTPKTSSTISSLQSSTKEEVNEAESLDESTTIKVAVKAVSKASVGKIEPKNIELSDAAETTGAEPKPKTAEKKVQNPNSGSIQSVSVLIIFPLMFFSAQLVRSCNA